MHRRHVISLFVAALVPGAAVAEPIYDEAGVALGGMDPVAYHVDEAARQGDPAQALMWHGSEWRFVNAANRRMFEADPKRYMPAFGGYSVVEVAEGRLVPGDPHLWIIRRGRLFLHGTPGDRSRFAADPVPIVERAAALWPDLAE